MTGPADYFALGDWNILCAQCGKKLKASRAVKNWQGTWRCLEHNEPRQPQDFVRGEKAEGQAAAFVQQPADLTGAICDYNGLSARAGYAMAGCMIAGRGIFNPDPRGT